jgi:hypothetical protein
MECWELVRTLAERGVSLCLDNGRIKANAPEKIADLLPDLKKHRHIMLMLAEGRVRVDKNRYKEVRAACPDTLADGQCHWCVTCEEWFPVMEVKHMGICTGRIVKRDDAMKEDLVLTGG